MTLAVQTKARRALAGVEKLAAAGFQQHYLLLALKHLDHFHFLVAEGPNRSSLPFVRQGNLRT